MTGIALCPVCLWPMDNHNRARRRACIRRFRKMVKRGAK